MYTDQLKEIGLTGAEKIYWNLSELKLIFQTIEKKQGTLSTTGALVCKTGEFTDYSAEDTYIVKDQLTEKSVCWEKGNLPYATKDFDCLCKQVTEFISKEDVYITDVYACEKKDYRLNIRVLSQFPWQSLFIKNMFSEQPESEFTGILPDWHIIVASDFKADPKKNNIRKQNFTIINFSAKSILIGGTAYSGEIKKAIFKVLNYILPLEKNVLPLQCSANIGQNEDVALFFGLSGTGKTTFSTDPSRPLIGDDEHGWDSDNLFNIESGCYSKCLNLSEEKEPQIFSAIRFGALLENASFFRDTDIIDFSNKKIGENIRATYPLHFIENTADSLLGNTPKNIFFLTCDAFGVFPPISKLTPEQAMYYFISGYTARIKEDPDENLKPEAVFTPCFSESVLPLHPGIYTELLGEKIKSNKVNVWLINTGWSGGSYGIGNRIKLSYTQSIIKAALNSELNEVNYVKQPVTNLLMPIQCKGIPSHLLDPENTWSDKDLYYKTLKKVAEKLIQNFNEYDSFIDSNIKLGGPTLLAEEVEQITE